MNRITWKKGKEEILGRNFVVYRGKYAGFNCTIYDEGTFYSSGIHLKYGNNLIYMTDFVGDNFFKTKECHQTLKAAQNEAERILSKIIGMVTPKDDKK